MSAQRDTQEKFSGNILLFYAFDIGDEINFEHIKRKRLLTLRNAPLSPYFKNYHIPLAFKKPNIGDDAKLNGDCIVSNINNFGALSFCYSVPYEGTFDELKHRLIEIHNFYNHKSKEDARIVYETILPAIEKPRFYHIENSYFVVQMNPKKGIPPEVFKEQYGSKIASLLRLEVKTLSDYQEEDILDSTTGYYGNDFMIIDSEASFIYDDDYFDTLEFFESATIQLLEVKFFDRLLDKTLRDFYQKPLTISWKAYIPLIGRRLETSVSKLVRLKVDISVIVERLEGSIQMVGDAYYSKLYSMLNEKLSLDSWKDGINKKLGIINDLYTSYQHRLETLHEEILTVVIIILITFEALLAFFS